MGVGGGPLGSVASGEPVHPSVLEAARAWAADDPDPMTRAEMEAVIASADGGDLNAAADLNDRMAGLLEFGTAGLRGALGAGPNRMNRSVVIRAAAGLTAYLKSLSESPFVVVGYDARTNSDVFARDTCAVVVAAGGRAALMPRTLPTPVLAYAVRALGADAGVMVTASHNPPQDNGYKVYVGDGSQIVPPVDGLIADQIAAVAAVSDVPRAESGWEAVEESVIEAYVRDAAAVVAADGPRDVTVVHSAMHGVGTETVLAAFAAAGFPEPILVGAQAEPDPMFPTVSFPTRRSRARWTWRWSSPSRPGRMSSSPMTPMPIGVRPRWPGRAGGGCCAATRWARSSGRTCWSGACPRGGCSRTRSCLRGCSRRWRARRVWRTRRR